MREMLRVRSVEETWRNGTGLGFQTLRINDKSYVGHGGGYPGYITQTLFQPADRFGVIVLTNSTDGEAGEIARQLIAAVGPLFGKPAAGPAPALWDPAWTRFQGVYRGRWNDMTVVVLNGRLVLLPSTASGIDGAQKLEALGGGRFRLDAPTGGAPIGETVFFQEEPGKPMRMVMGDNWMDRVDAP
jgi:hypothetical protein